MFGWKKLSPKMVWFSSLMVAVGSTLSAFWIIVANSWQQTPAGFHVVEQAAGKRAELTNFFQAVFNPSTIPRYLHTIDAAIATGAFFMLGISAWYLMKGKHVELAKRSLKTALVVGFIASILQLPLGHYHAQEVAREQPVKLAAIEGLFETQKAAPLLVFGIPDANAKKTHLAIGIPGGLSLLAFNDSGAEVKGLKDFNEEEWPPVFFTFATFHAMVGIGTYFVLFTLFGLILLISGKVYQNRLFLKLAMITVPLPFLANEFGWFSAEVGRQPWIVQNLLKTKDAFSVTVPGWQVFLSFLVFVVVYALLFWAWIHLLRKAVRLGPEQPEGVEQ